MRSFTGVALLMLMPLHGCNYASPRWAHPGPASLQQGRAVVFDPYPDPHAGPEIQGGRPWGYTQPAPPTVQAQRWQPPYGLQ